MNVRLPTNRKLIRVFANILGIFTILAVALPVIQIAYAVSTSPFLGYWQSTGVDGSDMRLTVSGPPNGPFRITWILSSIPSCNRGPGIIRGTGQRNESDPNSLEADLHLECFTTSAALDFHFEWRYHPITNTLSGRYDDGVTTVWRPGQPQPPLPTLELRVNYGQDWVESFYEADHTAWVTVTQSDGVTVKATVELITELKNDWNGGTGFRSLDSPWFDADGNRMQNPPDIQPNDWVFGWVDNGASAQVRIGAIHGTIKLVGDFVEGTISAPWFSKEVEVDCHSWGDPLPSEILKHDTVQPDNEDTYSCSWAGEWDIQPYQDVSVGYFGSDGHWVANSFFGADPTVVAYLPNAIEGYDWQMGKRIIVDINNGEYSGQAVSEQRPGAQKGATRVLFELWRDNFFIEVGDQITMTDGTITKQVAVTALSITGVDVLAGTVTGIYDPTSDLRVWLYGQEERVPITDPENATWTATFDELVSGTWGGATQRDIDGDGTSLDFQVPVTYFITNTVDVIANDGICTLREAVIAANSNVRSGNINGECPAGLDSQPDTILLVAGNIYSLTIDRTNNDTEVDGDLDIWNNSSAIDLVIKVDGDGKATISQDAFSVDDRVLENHEATVQIENLILTGGGNVGGGGGLLNNGTLDMISCEVSSNAVGWDGGGIYNSSVGTMGIDSSTISRNTSSAFAGGIMNKGTLTVMNSEITANTDVHGGGGINNEGTLTVSSSVLSANSSGQGGALYNTGTAALTNKTLIGGPDAGQGNVANDGGGGLFNLGTLLLENGTVSHNQAPYGGGLSNWMGGMLTISNSTISGNSANEGGGLHNKENSTTVIQNGSIFSSNYAEWSGGGIDNWGAITITGSILRDNVSPGEAGDAILSGVFEESTASITGSCIVGNGDTAVFTSLLTPLNATGNWWGDASGPGGKGPGFGDSVSDHIDFSPWLVESPSFCIPE